MTVTLERKPGQWHVHIKGHAKTPRVCASASALIQTLQAWAHGNDSLYIEAERITSGDSELKYVFMDADPILGPRDWLSADTAFEMICVGFLRLQETASDEIKVIISDVVLDWNNTDTGGITRD